MSQSTHDLLTGLQALHPIASQSVTTSARCGLVIVDVVNGFCTPGSGPLAPSAPDLRIDAMVAAIDSLAKQFAAAGRPIYAVRDEHEADRPEPPYPPHCIRGSGHEDLVDALAWLKTCAHATVEPKDCINLITGSLHATGRIGFYEWLNRHRLEQVVFAGICTEICVAEPVLTLLSARNHAATLSRARQSVVPTLRDVIVYEPGCATYNLPAEAVAALGLPPRATHDGPIAHHTGLWLMQSRGAIIAESIGL